MIAMFFFLLLLILNNYDIFSDKRQKIEPCIRNVYLIQHFINLYCSQELIDTLIA